MILFHFENTELTGLDEKKISQWIKQTAFRYGKKVGQVNYVFCDDERMLEVNKQYLQHDYYTDIITFDYSSGQVISGDMFISLDTVRSNAEELKINFWEELNRIVIHGILHLTGQDDKTAESRKEMTKKENEAIDVLHGKRLGT